MRNPLRFMPLVAVVFALATLGAAAEQDPLKYDWKKGTDHYYRVSIKVELDDGDQEFLASPIYHVADNTDGELSLLFLGSLTAAAPRVELTPFLRASAGVPATNDSKLTVSQRGKVIAIEGGHELPFLLGDLAQLPFVLLPKDDETTWTANREVTLSSSGDFRLPRGVQLGKSIKAEDETTYKIESTEGSIVTISIDSKLAALERIKQKPTLQLNTQATAKFDRELGAIISYEAKVDLSVRQKNTTTEIPIVVSVERMSAEEVAKLRKDADEMMAKVKAKMAADKAERERPIDREELDSIVKTLKSTDREKLDAVLRRLANKGPDAPDKRVSKAIEPHLKSKDVSVTLAAFDAFKNWGTEESLPALLATLDDQHSFGRMQAIQMLGKFPSKKTAEELALMLTDPSSHSMAAMSLKQMGKYAEEPTLAVLKKTSEKDLGQLLSIVSVLQEVGGAKSLAALKPFASSPSGGFMVQNAVKDIERRVERDKLRKR